MLYKPNLRCPSVSVTVNNKPEVDSLGYITGIIFIHISYDPSLDHVVACSRSPLIHYNDKLSVG